MRDYAFGIFHVLGGMDFFFFFDHVPCPSFFRIHDDFGSFVSSALLVIYFDDFLIYYVVVTCRELEICFAYVVEIFREFLICYAFAAVICREMLVIHHEMLVNLHASVDLHDSIS